MDLAGETYASLTTYRANGEPVATPVWVVGLADGRLGVWTASDSGKVRRLERDPRVTLQPCNVRGTVRDATSPVPGAAAVVRSGRHHDEVMGRLGEEYGVQARLTRLSGRLLRRLARRPQDPGTVILIRLDEPDVAQAKSD